MSDLLLTPISQSKLDEAGCLVLSQDSSSRGPEPQLDVTERMLLNHKSEVSIMDYMGLNCSPEASG